MHEQHYVFPTNVIYLIMFLKLLSHFIMKNKKFMKYFKEGVLKYFKISMKFLNISKWNISSCIPIYLTNQLPTEFHQNVVLGVAEATGKPFRFWRSYDQGQRRYKVRYLSELLRRAEASTSTLGRRSITWLPYSWAALVMKQKRVYSGPEIACDGMWV